MLYLTHGKGNRSLHDNNLQITPESKPKEKPKYILSTLQRNKLC
jgi:hypothetical protein